MKILVTGGSGFFGLHLIRGFLSKNYEVYNFDVADINEDELEERTISIKGDIRNSNKIEEACRGMDFVIHNAAVLPIAKAGKKYWEINVAGTKNVLEACLQHKVKKCIYISSSSPYGEHKEVPITEESEQRPVAEYGKSKVAAEQICREHMQKGLNVIILRPRTIIGTGRLGIFQILYDWLSRGKNIYIIGKGNNLFQFLSAQDFVSACLLAIESSCQNDDFNLGTDKFGTVREDLEALVTHAGKDSKVVSLPALPTKISLEILRRCRLVPFTRWHYITADKPFYFDISKAKKILGWQPLMSNFDMFKESYEWYLAHRATVESVYGTTHRNAVRQGILRVFRGLS